MPAPLPTVPAPLPAVPATVPGFRGRIGADARSGHHAVPYRYRLHVTLSCPHCLRLAVTHGLLGLGDTLPLTRLPAVPDLPDGGHSALRPLYEAGAHRYAGPAAAPVLSDDWTGRVVNNHAPDILADLTTRFRGPLPLPDAAPEEHAAVASLCSAVTSGAQRAGRLGLGGEGAQQALAALFGALDRLEQRLAGRPYVLGEALTASDVLVWVTLVRLDTVHRWHLDAAAVARTAAHPRLWAYARRLAGHPAFGSHLDLDGIAARHRADCRGRQAAGAAVHIVDWAAAVREGTAPRAR